MDTALFVLIFVVLVVVGFTLLGGGRKRIGRVFGGIYAPGEDDPARPSDSDDEEDRF